MIPFQLFILCLENLHHTSTLPYAYDETCNGSIAHDIPVITPIQEISAKYPCSRACVASTGWEISNTQGVRVDVRLVGVI